MTEHDLLKAVERQAREAANRQRRQEAVQEERNPKLPKPCQCPSPMRDYDPDGSPYCYRCTRSLAK